jgi:tRNA 5-methylaminomethyl-2-thiouridine biosynthesis bifunctional protein
LSINTAKIRFNENGNPIASDFEDVYFSEGNGLNESEHVFFENNHVGERWLSWSEDKFVIAETGFGTGLNALVTFDKFLKFRQQNRDEATNTVFSQHRKISSYAA